MLVVTHFLFFFRRLENPRAPWLVVAPYTIIKLVIDLKAHPNLGFSHVEILHLITFEKRKHFLQTGSQSNDPGDSNIFIGPTAN